MVQKIITGLSLILITSCSLVATQKNFATIAKEADALEEELDEVRQRSSERRKDLESKVKIVNDMSSEDQIFRTALSRMENALLQDIGELETRVDGASVSVQKISTIVREEDTSWKSIKESSNLIWEKRMQSVKTIFCAGFPESKLCTQVK
ncbi:hypothetical protein KKF34_15410 [Myxococcota bacterium]|nr:hypothetical protein [Myxococcota bacterium]MBU1382252.1 hypothetical protein [Myxococcota bacterium]MBU1498265.1 hypothetical protein [Myxococcota bacterium]